MGAIYLVRHGQAAFGTDDYDRLTPLGHQQAQWLGEYFAEHEVRFDAVYMGNLRRHRETWQGIAQAAQWTHAPLVRPALNEYQAELLLAAHATTQPTTQPRDRRAYFRLLREVLGAWVAGQLHAPTHVSFAQFSADIRAVLNEVQSAADQQILVVSSGGPIATVLGAVLDLAPTKLIELNLQARNTSVSELRFNTRNLHCVSFNTVPHLVHRARTHAVTYS